MKIKRGILLSALLSMKMFSFTLFSQCTPDNTINTEGISPKVSSPGCENTRYERTLFFTYRKDTVIFGMTLVIDSIFITRIDNLRPGLSYSVNMSKQIYSPSSNYYQNCINVFGTPTNALKAYDTIAVNITAYVSVFGTVNQFQDVMYAVLPVNPAPNVAVLKTGNVLNAVMGATSYNWLLCDFGYATIPNANGSVYTPTVSGNFAVEVNLNGCIDTSSCYNVNVTSISDELAEMGINVYPSLVVNDLHLQLAGNIDRIEVFDQLGREVGRMNIDSNSDNVTIPFSDQSSGTYFLKLYSSNRVFVRRIMKE
jgi:hypothetical protein